MCTKALLVTISFASQYILLMLQELGLYGPYYWGFMSKIKMLTAISVASAVVPPFHVADAKELWASNTKHLRRQCAHIEQDICAIQSGVYIYIFRLNIL